MDTPEDEFWGQLECRGLMTLLPSDLLPLKQPKVSAFSGSQKKLLHAARAVKVRSVVSPLPASQGKQSFLISNLNPSAQCNLLPSSGSALIGSHREELISCHLSPEGKGGLGLNSSPDWIGFSLFLEASVNPTFFF